MVFFLVQNPRDIDTMMTFLVYLSLFLFVLLWFCSHKLEVIDGKLRYKTLWGPEKIIKVEDISKLELQFNEYRTFKDRLSPPVALVVKTRDNRVAMKINTKVFRLSDIQGFIKAFSK